MLQTACGTIVCLAGATGVHELLDAALVLAAALLAAAAWQAETCSDGTAGGKLQQSPFPRITMELFGVWSVHPLPSSFAHTDADADVNSSLLPGRGVFLSAVRVFYWLVWGQVSRLDDGARAASEEHGSGAAVVRVRAGHKLCRGYRCDYSLEHQ